MSQNNYKCIRSYPGGPDVGYIINRQKSNFNGLWYWYNNVWFNPEDYTEYWESFVQEPLFTTEDGHDVHGAYTLFCIGIDSSVDPEDYWNVSEVKSFGLSVPNLIGYKWFYQKSNAEKYVSDNKPQYSKKDMLDLIKYCGYDSNELHKYLNYSDI